MKQRFCKVCGGWHYLDRPWPDNCREPDYWLRSEKPMPAIQDDRLPGGINGMLSHADGRRYDSRSKYLAEVKARGCEVVGNDKLPPREEKPWADKDIERALSRAIDEEVQKASIRPDHTEGPDVVRGL